MLCWGASKSAGDRLKSELCVTVDALVGSFGALRESVDSSLGGRTLERHSAGEGWRGVRVTCEALVEVAQDVQRFAAKRQVPAELVEKGAEALGAVAAAAAAAGIEAEEHIADGWLEAWEGLPDEALKGVVRIWTLGAEERKAGAGAGAGQRVGVGDGGRGNRTLEAVAIRAVVSQLQAIEPGEPLWAMAGGEIAGYLGLPEAGVRGYLLCVAHILGLTQGPGTRGREGRQYKMPALPVALTHGLVAALCEAKVNCGADALVLAQMLPDGYLPLVHKYCSELDREQTSALWNLSVIEHLTKALHDKGDERRVGWLLSALQRPQLNANNAEHIRAPFVAKLVEQFLVRLLHKFA